MERSRTQFRPDIEGLRGAAILLVVFFHAGVSHIEGGFVGVDVFFVLSGYFVTGLLTRELATSGTIDMPRFLAQRLLRLLPLMLVVLIATLIGVMTLYAPIDREAIASTARAVAVSASNIDFASNKVDYFSHGESPFLHTWSLAVEVQFYILWPFLILAMTAIARRRNKEGIVTVGALLIGLLVAGALSLGASVWMSHDLQQWAFFNIPARIWEFALGGMLAVTMVGAPLVAPRTGAFLQAVGLVALGFAVMSYDGGMIYPGTAAILPALGAFALIIGGAASPASTISDGLSFSWLRWLGRLSYAWYLWHWPLVRLGAAIDDSIGVLPKLALSGVALLLAWFTHKTIEETARTGALSRLPARQLLAAAVGVSLAAALISHLLMLSAERQASGTAQRAFTAARGDRMKHDCWATTVDEPKAPCVLGDTSASTTLVLLGDSHAEHWSAALDRAGRENGWKIVALVKGGCPVADMPEVISGKRADYYRECGRYREAMLRRIETMRPDAVILASWDHYLRTDGRMSSWKVSRESWTNGLRRTYSRMAQAGIRTVVMRDVPNTPFDVPACLSRKEAGLAFARDCTYDRAAALHPFGVAAQNEAARGLPISFIDMNDQLCTADRCSVVRNNEIVFTDDNHLTARFSRSVAPVLAQRLAAAIR